MWDRIFLLSMVVYFVGMLERVDKLSTKPGNRVPYLRQKGVQKCFAELTLCVTLSAS